MNTLRNIILWSILWFTIWFAWIIPFAYGIAHWAEWFLLIPFFTSLIWGSAWFFSHSSHRWLRAIWIILSVVVSFSFISIIYLFVVKPKIVASQITSYIKRIQPDSFEYLPVLYEGKNIGINIRARFSMNPDLKDITPHSSGFPVLPYISYNLYWYPRLELIQDGEIFTLSWVVLIPPIVIDNNQNYCLSQYSNISTWSYQKWMLTWNLIYPYFEWACLRGWDCFTRYEIPKTDITLDFDPIVFMNLSKCNF